MLSHSNSYDQENRIIEITKSELNKIEDLNSFNRFMSHFQNRNSENDFLIPPFEFKECNDNIENVFTENKLNLSQQFSNGNSNLLYTKHNFFEMENLVIHKNYKISDFNSTSSFKSKSILTNKKNKNISENKRIWKIPDKIEFLAVFLIYEVFYKKIKLSTITMLMKTKTYSQIYQHYYKFKKILKSFSKLFFNFYKCDNVNNKIISELTLEELFKIFKNNLTELNFIKYLGDNLYDNKSMDYFQNIFSYSTYLPKFFITTKNKTIEFNSNKKVLSNLSKKTIRDTSPAFKSNSKISEENDISEKLIGDCKIKNLRLKIDEDFDDNINTFSNNSNKAKTIILDDNFLINFLISKIDSKTSDKQ